ncbi:unnamed protein product [Bursaphelenchus xylophilus]|uniref:Glycosyltransferase family 92 protein n=1 Tax=Bursaphelenchus xylophilus TaxID=6326 RepID=A0A7I8WYF3_BURXY|nr:unnamed protein product [Bursaphelenchus xylophilus]CAG9100981.1 unnamed protein product [Bursaphelenchus xylophilus]
MVRNVLSRSIEIQLIDWSKIPKSKSPKDFDPNLYLYRLEPELAIFDCMQRMRKMAKFVVQTDIDEIIYLNSNGNLIDYLERLERTYPNMASVNFRSQRVRIDNSWNSLSTPENFHFYPLKYSAKFEDRIFERSLYSKNIYIPDRVENFDIHFRFPTKNRFIHYNASISDGLILHLRQLPDIFPWKHKRRPLLLPILEEVTGVIGNLDWALVRYSFRIVVVIGFVHFLGVVGDRRFGAVHVFEVAMVAVRLVHVLG